ncbi:MAG: protein translocase subunit SecD [Elusimicrobiota bacterium]
MNSKLKFKILLILGLCAVSGWYLYPTFEWYQMSVSERENMEKARDPIIKRILNLGLDLKGGMHLVLEVDVAKLDPNTKVNDAVNRAIEVIRNRIDQFGVAEPVITKQGERWIAVQLPGVKEPQRAIELIGRTALLEFRLEDNTGQLSKIQQKAAELKLGLADLGDMEGLLKPELQKDFKDIFPASAALLPSKEGGYKLVESSASLTGAYLTNAQVKMGGEYGAPYVGIDFNKEGAVKFADLTAANIQRNLAIVLDGVVQSAPVIKSAISDGQAIIEGNFTIEDARDLALVLRAGALPAPVNIIENRTIGPSLGEDSVRKGVYASLVGLLIVITFMVFYYKLSGLIADLAVILNLFMLLGAMAYFHATLTLPGIAGIILTLGMAVDANVLIFERIREELRAGKTVRVSVDLGYEKAFSAIIDSNLTTLIAAAFLFQFGTGPIKGFAVTLTLGIIISMFTAIVVSHVIYDLFLGSRPVQKLSI